MSAFSTPLYPQFTGVTTLLSVSTSAIAPAAPVNREGLVFFDVQNADVMVTLDGVTTPTATVGHRLTSGAKYVWPAVSFAKAKFIRQAGVDAVIYSTECYGL